MLTLAPSVRSFAMAACVLVSLPAGNVFAEEAASWWPNQRQIDASSPTIDSQDRDKSGLLGLPSIDMSWPAIKAPQLGWKPAWIGANDGSWENALKAPFNHLKQATETAASHTRIAWNKTVGELPIIGKASGDSNGQVGAFGRFFRAEPQSRRTRPMTGFLSQERLRR